MQIYGRKHLNLDEYTNEIAQVTSTCPRCDSRRTFDVSLDALYNWVCNGGLAQRTFPDLSSSDREALITGICDECWPYDGEMS